MGEGELANLLGGGFREFFHAVAQRRAPKAGQPLDVLPAVLVPNPDALPPFDHQRAVTAESGKVRRRMEDRQVVAI